MTNKELDVRITRLEDKVDKLLAFRGWVLGLCSAISVVSATLVTWIVGRP